MMSLPVRHLAKSFLSRPHAAPLFAFKSCLARQGAAQGRTLFTFTKPAQSLQALKASLFPPRRAPFSTSRPSLRPTSPSATFPSLTFREKVVGSWFVLSGGLVFGIVVLGGLTRLTESGLSIVEWKPLAGALPPTSREDWEAEFEKYKRSPEFIINNHDITLEEFKKIFWMEWAHRQMGRFIGLEFVLPGLFFIAAGWVNRPMAKRILAISGLIGFQGLLGWIMVKSGLDQEIVEERAVPRVSHFRLAAHLGTALAIYGGMVWSALDVFKNRVMIDPNNTAMIQGMRRLRGATHATLFLIATTIVSGALVAGLDAGLVYNEFPMMGNSIVPSDYTSDQPFWKNVFYNPSAVQFNHRALAITTASVVAGVYGYSRTLALPGKVRVLTSLLAGVAAIQVTLGITTLVYFVPIPLASAHQGGSVALLTCALALFHTLKSVR